MSIWAIADLHLPFGVPEKNMESFGPEWKNYTSRLSKNWKKSIRDEDLVLIPGDISWALKFSEALIDLEWLDALPGTKVLLKGNHDYWWPSNKKLKENLPPSIYFINNTAMHWKDVAIGGARLWDTEEYSFEKYISFKESPLVKPKLVDREKDQKIYDRDLEKLKYSLEQLSPNANYRIAMTHYPPIGPTLEESRASKLLEKFQIDVCVFGHLHNVKKDLPLFGKKNHVLYSFVSADYLNFVPLCIMQKAGANQ